MAGMIAKNATSKGLGLCLLSMLSLAGCDPSRNPAPQAVGPGTLNVADAAIAGGDAGLALSITQSVLAADPGNADALVHEGDAYYALGRCPAATAAYQLALKAGEGGAAEAGLGRCLLKTDAPDAVLAFRQAVRDDPGNAAAYNDLGIAYDLEDQFTAAADAYRHALIANPEMTAAEVNLGLSLALAGNGPAALQFLGPLASGQNATPKIREDYAAALIADDQEDEARTVLSIDLPPGKVDAALAGFNAVIAGDQPPLAAATAGAPPARTVAAAPVAPVAAVTPLAPPIALAPAPEQPPPRAAAEN